MSRHSIQRHHNAGGSSGRLAQVVQFIAHVSIILCALGLSTKLDWPPSIRTAISKADITSHMRPATKPTDRRPATIPLATVGLEYPFVQDLSKSLCHDPKFSGEHPTRYRTNEIPQDAMNLQDVYKRLGNNITRANDGDRIKNHGYKICCTRNAHPGYASRPDLSSSQRNRSCGGGDVVASSHVLEEGLSDDLFGVF